MKFFRNPEIKKDLFFHAVLTVLFGAAGLFFSPFAALLVLLTGFSLTLWNLYSTYVRYRRIQELSQEISLSLHNTGSLHFPDYTEGELSILKIEIGKLFRRLQEQSDALTREKAYLADSLADISHQVRTPLTSIHLILSLLSEPSLDPKRRRTLVRQLSLLISRIDWLIEALLKISRLDAGTVTFQREQVPVPKVIQSALEPLEIPMELRDQTLHIIQKTGQETFLGDFSWTVEALGNILKNCMEHTPQGGEIRIFTCENAIFTEISVEDDGPGFAEEDLPRLFERFYKGKSSGEQSIGIGLALARMILVRENGSIKGENVPGGGARFQIRFYHDFSAH